MSTNILHPYLIESRTGEMFKGQARVKVSGVCMWSGILKEELTFQSFTLYLFLSIMLKFSTQIITDNSINYHMISFFIQSRLLSAFYLHIAQQLVPLHDVSEPKFLLMLIRVSQKTHKSKFCFATNPSGFHRLDEPPEKISAL